MSEGPASASPAPAAALPQSHEPPLVHPTPGQLFWGFLVLGMTSFGGALPMVRSMVVERKRWADAQEFTDLLGLCQFLPGGNVINLSVALGGKFCGVRGSIAAMTGFIAVPSAVVIAFGVIYDHYRTYPRVEHVFEGLAAAAAGLLIATVWKIGRPLLRKWLMLGAAALVFAAIALLRLPLLPTMLVLTPVSIAATWRTMK